MGLRENSYAKVWTMKQNGQTYSCRVSVSRKDPESNEYKTLFSGYVNFAGEAAKKASELGLPERMDRENPVYRSIQIKSSPDLSTWYNKAKVDELISLAGDNDKLISFIRAHADEKSVTIWDFELAENSPKDKKNNHTAKKKKTEDFEPIDDDDDYPF